MPLLGFCVLTETTLLPDGLQVTVAKRPPPALTPTLIVPLALPLLTYVATPESLAVTPGTLRLFPKVMVQIVPLSALIVTVKLSPGAIAVSLREKLHGAACAGLAVSKEKNARNKKREKIKSRNFLTKISYKKIKSNASPIVSISFNGDEVRID